MALLVGQIFGIAVHAAFLWSAVHLIGVRVRRKSATLNRLEVAQTHQAAGLSGDLSNSRPRAW